jgi:hypothetical protein
MPAVRPKDECVLRWEYELTLLFPQAKNPDPNKNKFVRRNTPLRM